MTRTGALLPALAVAAATLASAQTQTSVAPGSVPPAGETTPTRDAAHLNKGTARIRGRVFAADTGTPLRSARVRIFAPELREERTTSTDSEGRYQFAELASGRYYVGAGKGGYVTLSYGERLPFQPGKPLQLLDGATLEKVDFALARGGVITGRVVDEYGDPAADITVGPQLYRFINGRKQLMPAGRFAETNDIGEFRIFGLPPGQYYVVATPQGGRAGDSDERNGYAPTFYPDTSDVAQAQRVSVGVGQTRNDVNITLSDTRIARIIGSVIDAEGKTVTDGFVTVSLRGHGFGMTHGGGPIRPDGTFVISNLPPGEYEVQWSKSGDESIPQFADATVTVAGEDVTGVRLTETRPARAIGRLILDGVNPQAVPRASTFRVYAVPQRLDQTSFGPFRGGGDNVPDDDSTFQIRVRPCICVIRLMGPQNGWYLKSVRLNGSDITDSGIDFRADQQTDGIEVVLTQQTTNVSGLVADDHGDPSRDYTVIVFGQDRDQWFGGSRYFSEGRPDQDGRYRIRGLPAGRYYAIALDSLEPGEASDPDLLEQLRPKAMSLMLNEGEAKTLDLRLVTR